VAKTRKKRYNYDEMQKVTFYADKDEHVRLKIRLQQDSLTQSDFFRCMLQNYIDKDEAILDLVNNYKEKHKRQNAERRKKVQKSLEKGRDVKTKFALDDNEIENIFDLLEQEHPEL
jgi:formiminotetrahydrofolate cyclodeaminase